MKHLNQSSPCLIHLLISKLYHVLPSDDFQIIWRAQYPYGICEICSRKGFQQSFPVKLRNFNTNKYGKISVIGFPMCLSCEMVYKKLKIKNVVYDKLIFFVNEIRHGRFLIPKIDFTYSWYNVPMSSEITHKIIVYDEEQKKKKRRKTLL